MRDTRHLAVIESVDANMSTTAYQNDPLRSAIEAIADQLCPAVDGTFDFRVKVDAPDPSVEKLQMLINFVLDAARRSIDEHQALNAELNIAMQQVETSFRQAEQANRAKSDFLANMSHELRTPLTAILGFSATLRDECDLAQQSTLDIIHRNGEHLLHVINDVLDLSKVESGCLETVIRRVDAVEVIDDVIRALAPPCVEKGVDLRREFKTTIPRTIETDPLRFRQILTNLINNAVKFTERGSVVCEISYHAKPHDTLSIDVVDTGIGIAAKDIQKLFQPFSQADTSSSRNFGGTGLGLVISRRFAQLLGGGVDIVESHPGKGTRIRCEVAANLGHEVELIESDRYHRSARPAANSEVTTEDLSFRHLRVLLAEDGIDNQRLISHLLKKKGILVTTAENGQIAINLVVEAAGQNQPYDIILMDMQMPRMDGYTAASHLRSLNIETPIIALTAHAMTGDREKCLSAGCDDYTTKPIKPKDLYGKILMHSRIKR